MTEITFRDLGLRSAGPDRTFVSASAGICMFRSLYGQDAPEASGEPAHLLSATKFYDITGERAMLIGEFRTETPHVADPIYPGLMSVREPDSREASYRIHEIAPGFAKVASLADNALLDKHVQKSSARDVILYTRDSKMDVDDEADVDHVDITLFNTSSYKFSAVRIRADNALMIDYKRVLYHIGTKYYLWSPKRTLPLDIFKACKREPRLLTAADFVMRPYDKITYLVLDDMDGAIHINRKTGKCKHVFRNHQIPDDFLVIDKKILVVHLPRENRIVRLDTDEDITDNFISAARKICGRDNVEFAMTTRCNVVNLDGRLCIGSFASG